MKTRRTQESPNPTDDPETKKIKLAPSSCPPETTAVLSVKEFLERKRQLKLKSSECAHTIPDELLVAELRATTGLAVGDLVLVLWEVESGSNNTTTAAEDGNSNIEFTDESFRSSDPSPNVVGGYDDNVDEFLLDSGSPAGSSCDECDDFVWYSATLHFPEEGCPRTLKEYWAKRGKEIEDSLTSENDTENLEEIKSWLSVQGNTGIWLLKYDDSKIWTTLTYNSNTLDHLPIQEQDKNNIKSPNAIQNTVEQNQCLVFFPDGRHAVHIDYMYPSHWDSRPFVLPSNDSNTIQDMKDAEQEYIRRNLEDEDSINVDLAELIRDSFEGAIANNSDLAEKTEKLLGDSANTNDRDEIYRLLATRMRSFFGKEKIKGSSDVYVVQPEDIKEFFATLESPSSAPAVNSGSSEGSTQDTTGNSNVTVCDEPFPNVNTPEIHEGGDSLVSIRVTLLNLDDSAAESDASDNES